MFWITGCGMRVTVSPKILKSSEPATFNFQQDLVETLQLPENSGNEPET